MIRIPLLDGGHVHINPAHVLAVLEDAPHLPAVVVLAGNVRFTVDVPAADLALQFITATSV